MPSGPGRVTVSWTPPADTGGAPLTRYVVRVNGVRQVLPADASRLVVRDVVAGPQSLSVRARNAVATSDSAPGAVEVPAYPTVIGPATARKKSTVALTVSGLVPGAPRTVTLAPAGAGEVAQASRVREDGTATVRVLVKRTLRVVVAGGDIASPPHRIKVPSRR